MILALLVAATFPDIGPQAWQRELTSETRAREYHMGLAAREVRFGSLGEREGSEICGILRSDSLVVYSTSPACRRAWLPPAPTLPEVCHDRMGHPHHRPSHEGAGDEGV